jgi:hypothetical protein
MKGNYLTGIYLLQFAIVISHHGLTSVGTPERPLLN